MHNIPPQTNPQTANTELYKSRTLAPSPAPAEIWPPLKQTQGCWGRCGDRFLLDGTAARTVQREGGVERTDNYKSKQRKPDGLRAERTDILTPAEQRSKWEHQHRTNRRRTRSPSTWNNTDPTNYNKAVVQLLLNCHVCHRKNDTFSRQLYSRGQQSGGSVYRVKFAQVNHKESLHSGKNRKLKIMS